MWIFWVLGKEIVSPEKVLEICFWERVQTLNKAAGINHEVGRALFARIHGGQVSKSAGIGYLLLHGAECGLHFLKNCENLYAFRCIASIHFRQFIYFLRKQHWTLLCDKKCPAQMLKVASDLAYFENPGWFLFRGSIPNGSSFWCILNSGPTEDSPNICWYQRCKHSKQQTIKFVLTFSKTIFFYMIIVFSASKTGEENSWKCSTL